LEVVEVDQDKEVIQAFQLQEAEVVVLPLEHT
jgi:hypothetical protein